MQEGETESRKKATRSMRVWGKDKERISSSFVEELIPFRHESLTNSVALFKAAGAPISRPQIVAGHYRGEDFNLVADVGSREERHKRSLCFSKGVGWKWHISSWENLTASSARNRHARRLHELVFLHSGESEGHTTAKL